jgi:hypothetical protein
MERRDQAAKPRSGTASAQPTVEQYRSLRVLRPVKTLAPDTGLGRTVASARDVSLDKRTSGQSRSAHGGYHFTGWWPLIPRFSWERNGADLIRAIGKTVNHFKLKHSVSPHPSTIAFPREQA